MRRAYVDTPHGQLHLRAAGEGGDVLLMIHWTPFSGRMYEPVAPLLADAGHRVLAPDLLGYGRSDPRPADWSVGDWADNLAAMLDALDVAQVHALGGHMGAAVATELALRRPHRVRALIVDGAPLMSAELRAAFAQIGAMSAPASGEELLARVNGLLREYRPDHAPEGDGLARLWPAIADYLATGFVSSAPVAAAYDLAARLPLVTQPALLLGAAKDSLAGNFEPAHALLNPRMAHFFAGDHPVHEPERASDYAAPLLAFLEELA